MHHCSFLVHPLAAGACAKHSGVWPCVLAESENGIFFYHACATLCFVSYLLALFYTTGRHHAGAEEVRAQLYGS